MNQKFQTLMKNSNLTDHGLVFLMKKNSKQELYRRKPKNWWGDRHPLQIEDLFLKNTLNLLNDANVVILQDYNKGVLTKGIITKLILEAKERGIPTIVDPKKNNFLEFKNCDIFKPNLKEIKEGMEIDFNEKIENELEIATSKLREELNARAILLTLSSDGICINSGDSFNLTSCGWCIWGRILLFVLSPVKGVSYKNIKISCLSGSCVKK